LLQRDEAEGSMSGRELGGWQASLLGVAAAFFLASATAHADPPSAPAPDAPPDDTRWYGWQTLLADGAVIGIHGIALAAGRGSMGLVESSLAWYALTAPAIHFFHGRPGIALADAGLRVVVPCFLAVGFAATAGSGLSSLSDAVTRAVAGGTIGVLLASGFDAAVLANEPMPPKDELPSASFDWSPQIGVTPRGGPSLGVRGSF
jgi:hypothetical protein